MNQGVYPLAAAMINQINRLDKISNNLSNMDTNGFRQEGVTQKDFNYYLQRAEKDNFTPSKVNIVTNTIPKIDMKYIDSTMGAINPTGNKLDFALTKPELFFVIQNANGDIVYTKDGAFKNLDNFLVDSNGNNVLNAGNEPIQIDDNFELQIAVVQIPFNNLEKIGDNTYKIKNLANQDIFENNDGLIVQGAIEKSNVNPVKAMVGLIDAQRSFEQSQKAVKTIDEINSRIIEKIGNNTR